MHKRFISTLAVLLAMLLSVFSSGGKSFAEQTAKSAVISMPAGKTISATVTTPLNSKYLSVGQTVTAVITDDLYYGGKLILPADSVVMGSVINVTPASSTQIGELVLRFTNIVTPYGIQVPVSAIVNTGDKRGKLTGAYYTQEEQAESNVVIPIAETLDLLLLQPITVNPELYNSNY